MKKMKVTIDQDTLSKIDRGNRRKARLEQGLNDNRFVTRAVKSKKKYSKKDRSANKKIEW
jgi:hypothetical protein